MKYNLFLDHYHEIAVTICCCVDNLLRTRLGNLGSILSRANSLPLFSFYFFLKTWLY